MSPIIDLQRRLVELGRIRTGDQVAIDGRPGRTRPRRLDTFRLTSPRRDLIEEAARLYGGQARAWGEQWEVTVAAETIPIMLPPGEVVSQWMEMWSGGGCQRRCDGRREVLSDGPCLCPADPAERSRLAAKGEACKPTTRVNVILPGLPGLGVWRLESHGYYAAVELAGAAEWLSMATSVGHRIPAHLRIVTRTVKRPAVDAAGKATVQTRTFTVPTIDIDVRPAELLGGAEPVAALAAPRVERLPAGPVDRRERVPRPPLPGGADLPDEARLEREPRPPLPGGADLPDEARLEREPRPPLPPPPAIEAPSAPPERPAAPVAGEIIELPAVTVGTPSPGLSAAALGALAKRAMVTKGAIALAFGALGREVPAPAAVTAAVTALTDAERGALADELNLDWRGPAT